MKHIALLLILSAVTGCGLKSAGMVPPAASETWSKDGASKLDVGKSLLECGFPDTAGVTGHRELSSNDRAIIYFCMERVGYRRRGRSLSSAELCRIQRSQNLPACQPGAVIPAPSVKKRLNSRYCMKKDNRDRPVCQP